MNKAGGIISIIAGIFGFIAAIATLFIGGVGSAFKADAANQIMGFGWGGVFFSFLVIVFGALAFSNPKFSGIATIISSVLGAVLGGTFVAICMALSVIGGILTLFGKTTTTPREEMLPAENNSNDRKIHWIWWGIGGIASVFVVLLIIGIAATDSKKPPEPEQEQQEEQQQKPQAQAPVDPLGVLENAPVDDLRPDGELAEIFAIGSKNTDLQRERKLKSITGKIVQWRLPVYEVSLDGELYKVQTKGIFGQNVIGTFVYLSPRNEEEKAVIEALKTDDFISFKGRIYDSFMRNLQIKPAILALPEISSQQTDEPVSQEDQAQNITTPSANVGNTEAMDNRQTIENQAIQKQHNDTDSLSQESKELARYKAKDEQDAANGRINVVWQSTTKSIREALLPEQRAWLKEREGICTLGSISQSDDILQETIKYQCMAKMTDGRTEELKQKIALLTQKGFHN